MDVMTKEEKITKLKDWLSKTEVDPVVTKDTLGIALSNVSAQLLLTASEKVLKVNKLEIPPDDRDSLKYSVFMGLEDFMKEHIDKDAGRLQKKAAMKMQQKKNLSWLHPSFFTPQIRSVVIGNSLTNNVDGINPLEHYDNSHRVTKLGEGGIQSTTGVPDESRMINPSSFGFFDPVHISESERVGVTNYIAHNVVKGKDQKLYRLMKDNNGKLQWYDHEHILNSKVAIPEI